MSRAHPWWRRDEAWRWAFRATGAGFGIVVMELFARLASEPLSRVPFVTSIVLVCAMPDAPAARTRAIVGGHVVSALAGWACLTLIGPGDGTAPVAVGLATLLMLATRTLHPPAGLDAFLVVREGLKLDWVVVPILLGALILAGYVRAWERLTAAVLGAGRVTVGRARPRADPPEPPT